MSNKGALIDTSAWVLFLRGDEAIEEHLTDLIREERAYTNELILLELLRGTRSKKEHRMLHDDFDALPFAALDDRVWRQAYGLAFSLRQSGINVPIVDTLIAVLASVNNLALLHRDKHFPLIAGEFKLDLIAV